MEKEIDRIAGEMRTICAAEAEAAKFDRICDCKGFQRLNGLEFDSQDLRELDIRKCPACKKPFKKKNEGEQRPKRHIAEQFNFPFAGDHRISVHVDGKLLVSLFVGIKPKNLREVVKVLQEGVDLQESPVVEHKDLI